MVFLTKTYNKIFYKKLKVIYSLKVYTDFIFFNFLVQEYITLYNISLLKFLKTFIYLLNLVAIKYILFIHYFNVFYIKNYVENRIYILELFYWKNKHFTNINNTTTNNIEQKILLIKKISRTRKKGRIKRYKVVILIGNKSGWFGIGSSKDYYLQEAISNARLHAYKNIYQIPIFYSKILKNNIYIDKKVKKLYLFASKYKVQTPAHYTIRVLFDFIGITNISSKIIGINNIYNILSLILNI